MLRAAEAHRGLATAVPAAGNGSHSPRVAAGLVVSLESATTHHLERLGAVGLLVEPGKDSLEQRQPVHRGDHDGQRGLAHFEAISGTGGCAIPDLTRSRYPTASRRRGFSDAYVAVITATTNRITSATTQPSPRAPGSIDLAMTTSTTARNRWPDSANDVLCDGQAREDHPQVPQPHAKRDHRHRAHPYPERGQTLSCQERNGYQQHRGETDDPLNGDGTRVAESAEERRPVEADLIDGRIQPESCDQPDCESPLLAYDVVNEVAGEQGGRGTQRCGPKESEPVRLPKRLEQQIRPVLHSAYRGVEGLRDEVVHLARELSDCRSECDPGDRRHSQHVRAHEDRRLDQDDPA